VSDTPDEIAKLKEIITQRDAALVKSEQRVEQLAQRVALLESFLRRSLRGRFIPSSEKISRDPDQQLIDLPGISEPETPTQPLVEVADGTPGAGQPTPRRRGRRRPLALMYPELEVDLVEVDLEPHQKMDADGTPLVRMGYEDAETLVWGIAAPIIRLTRRFRYGRSDTAEKMAIAAIPARLTPKGILADETIHSAVIGHVLDALPWHRQEVMSQRAGCRIPRSVLVNGWDAWCAVMSPLANAIRCYVLAQPVIGADSTVMPHQDGKKPLRCTTTALWAMTDGMAVAMQWTPDLKHERAAEVLGNYSGTLIRDEWDGWKYQVNAMNRAPPGQGVLLRGRQGGCHAHARRRFTDLQGVDQRADRALRLYGSLYQLEQAAVERAYDGADLIEARSEIRSQRSRRVWQDILSLAREIVRCEGPSTAIYRAANYIVKYHTNLELCWTDGRLPIDNNGTENVLRIVALIRKNRLFLGRSPEAGPRLAIALTVLRSCHLVGLNPLSYLMQVTPYLLKLRDEPLITDGCVDLSLLLPHVVAQRTQPQRFGTSSIARAS